MMAASMLLVGFLSLLSLAYAGSGSYTFEGPNYWPIIFPTCNGGRQSPIDIKLSDVQDIYLYNNLKFKNYGAEYTGTFSTYNNTLQWDIDSNKPPQIKGTWSMSSLQRAILNLSSSKSRFSTKSRFAKLSFE